ncbi:glycosyltransferase [bacterium]|nr:glycosyltransferase [bacterium]
MKKLSAYRNIVGDAVIGEIYHKVKPLYGKRILHVNSTFIGGGVAEILTNLTPLMNNVGLDADWRILHGNTDLFEITKKFHNALQGDDINLTSIKKKLYLLASEAFSAYAKLDHDLVIIHDPQPLPLIEYYKKRQPWIWRCHIDLSNPNPTLWDFLKGYIIRYDLGIFSHEQYTKKDLPVRQTVIQPVIDPMTPKNMELKDREIAYYLKKYNIPTDKPIITQISRFDKWKDPLGVVEVFLKVKEKIDCRLVLCGNMATDDPEGIEIFKHVQERVQDLIDRGDVLLVTVESNVLVNALQRISAVVMQKSIREGFGLTVTEAMWKERPVLASRVGGIPLQITDGVNGFLNDPDDYQGFADRAIELLNSPSLAKEMGQRAKETIREKFLITRLLRDYIDIISYELGFTNQNM